MRQKPNLITLGVDDIKKSLEFYEKGLGWKKSDASLDDLALFPLGGYGGYFKDLDKHLFEVAFNPLWELDENDNLKL